MAARLALKVAGVLAPQAVRMLACSRSRPAASELAEVANTGERDWQR